MNILHIYKDYYPVEGGIENHIKALAEAQAARGHRVSVLVTSRTRQTHVEHLNGVRVVFAARLATISSAPISLTLFRWLAREKPDIVHLQFPYPWGELANHWFGRGAKTIMTYQSDIVRQKYLRIAYAPLMQRVLAGVDQIIATSPNYIASSPVLARWKNKCTAIPMGINPAPFLQSQRVAPCDSAPSPFASESLAATRYGNERRAPRLLFVGALRYYKGLQYLLRALPAIPEAELVVIGRGPMQRTWQELAHELGVGRRVNFIGEVANPQLPPYYDACDVFVFPSCERSEAFGLVQLEAMAAGKPVVCTELGTGTSFVNVNHETGLVVPPRDPATLADAIRQLLDDPERRAQMGAAGRARVLREFTLEKMVDRIMGLYESTLERGD